MSDFRLKVPESINSADEIFSPANKIDPMEETKKSMCLPAQWKDLAFPSLYLKSDAPLQ